MLLKRESSIPIYQQVADSIINMIEIGELEKGDRLPTEYDLVDKYKVSRATIRKAIAQLVEKDMITVSPGKGMYVKNTLIEMDFNELKGIYEILTQQGVETYTKLHNFEKVIPPPHILKRLNLPQEEEVYLIERIYFVENNPLAFSIAYFPSSIEFLESQVKEMKLYELIEKQLSIPLDEARYKIEVSSGNESINQILNKETKSHYLKMDRTTFCTDKKPREVTVAYFCSDLYQFNFSISKNGGINI